jgi:hypothetical protein
LSLKRFTALIAAASTFVACAAPPATHSAPTTVPSAQLGTVSPAYPVGTELADGVEVIETIPTADLSTTEPMPMDATKTCAANVPADVVTPAGVIPTAVESDEFGCSWEGSGHALTIGVLTHSMAKEVEEHLAMAHGGSTDRLAHLAWLRIDGHYAIERILEFDRSKSCWLSLDVSSTAIVHVVMNSIDSAGEPTKSDAETSVRKLCPVARQVARNLLNHLDDQQPGWWETGIHPTR